MGNFLFGSKVQSICCVADRGGDILKTNQKKVHELCTKPAFTLETSLAHKQTNKQTNVLNGFVTPLMKIHESSLKKFTTGTQFDTLFQTRLLELFTEPLMHLIIITIYFLLHVVVQEPDPI